MQNNEENKNANSEVEFETKSGVTELLDGLSFIDGVHKHREYPNTYRIPSDEEKLTIIVGDLVKLGIASDDPESGIPGERFWMKITEIRDDNFTGCVTNNLVFADLHGVYHGDSLTIEARHILGHDTPEEESDGAESSPSVLLPIEELYELPENYEEGLDIDFEDLGVIDMLSLPEDLLLYTDGVSFERVGESLFITTEYPTCDCPGHAVINKGISSYNSTAAQQLINRGVDLVAQEVISDEAKSCTKWKMTPKL